METSSGTKGTNVEVNCCQFCNQFSYKYDSEANAGYITLKDVKVSHSQVITDEFILDIDNEGNVIGVEILNVVEK